MSYFSGGELYSGTVSDFSGSDPLILKQEIRTDRYDAKQLNSKYKHTPLRQSYTLHWRKKSKLLPLLRI